MDGFSHFICQNYQQFEHIIALNSYPPYPLSNSKRKIREKIRQVEAGYIQARCPLDLVMSHLPFLFIIIIIIITLYPAHRVDKMAHLLPKKSYWGNRCERIQQIINKIGRKRVDSLSHSISISITNPSFVLYFFLVQYMIKFKHPPP